MTWALPAALALSLTLRFVSRCALTTLLTVSHASGSLHILVLLHRLLYNLTNILSSFIYCQLNMSLGIITIKVWR